MHFRGHPPVQGHPAVLDLHHHDHLHVGDGIDPEEGAPHAGPEEGARISGAARRFHDADAVAEPGAGIDPGQKAHVQPAGVRAQHQVDQGPGEQGLAAERPAVGQHGGEIAEVRCRGHETPTPGQQGRLLQELALRARFREGDPALVEDQRLLERVGLVLVHVDQPVLLALRHVEARVLHLQRGEDVLPQVGVQGHLGHRFDEGALDVAGDAVAEPLARHELELDAGEVVHHLAQAVASAQWVGQQVANVDPVLDAAAVAEPGGVREQLMDGDDLGLAVVLERGELRKVLSDVIVQRHLALIHELQQGERRDRLAHGVDAEDRFLLHRGGLLEIHLAIGLVVNRGVSTLDEDDGAGQFVLFEEGAELLRERLVGEAGCAEQQQAQRQLPRVGFLHGFGPMGEDRRRLVRRV